MAHSCIERYVYNHLCKKTEGLNDILIDLQLVEIGYIFFE